MYKQANLCEFKASLVHVVNPILARASPCSSLFLWYVTIAVRRPPFIPLAPSCHALSYL